jgi:hypothetical protein
VLKKKVRLLSDIKGNIVQISYLVLVVLNMFEPPHFGEAENKASAGGIPKFLYELK